jgi:hypothetical protein
MGVELDILFLAFEVNFELRFSLGSPSKRFFGIIRGKISMPWLRSKYVRPLLSRSWRSN